MADEPKICDEALETRVAVLIERMQRIEEKTELKFQQVDKAQASRDKALELQAVANKDHFTALNHEAARIQKATEITVSRDTWVEFLKSYQMWQAATDRSLQGSITREEFQLYKDVTDKALTLKAGQSQGIGMMMGTAIALISSIAALTAIGGFLVTLFRH